MTISNIMVKAHVPAVGQIDKLWGNAKSRARQGSNARCHIAEHTNTCASTYTHIDTYEAK